MKLQIFKEVPARVPLKKLHKMFAKLSEEEKKPGWEGSVNLVFIDDEAMSKLNKDYRKSDGPTDVLAFSIDHPNSEASILGEVYVSVPTAQRQARENGVTLAEELLTLSCHGLLHLFGYDHAKKRDAEQMKALQDYFVAYSERRGDG